MNSIILSINASDDLSQIVKSLKISSPDELIVVATKNQLSTDIIKKGKGKTFRFIECESENLAARLNLAVSASKGELLLFLGAGCVPDSGWINAMEKAASSAGIIVGETNPKLSPKAGPHERLLASLYQGHSKRAAFGQGYAFPWGPLYNLGVKREWIQKTGPFSSAASGAVDMDWCWRALISGAEIAYAPKAKVKRKQLNSREQTLVELESFGANEIWLQRTYRFLTGEAEFQLPVLAGIDAFRRLRYGPKAAKAAPSMQSALEEAAIAFSGGLRAALAHPHRACPIERKAPERAISWKNLEKSETVFVPNKGITELKGKPLELWQSYRKGAEMPALERQFQKLFKVNAEEARHGLKEFLDALS